MAQRTQGFRSLVCVSKCGLHGTGGVYIADTVHGMSMSSFNMSGLNVHVYLVISGSRTLVAKVSVSPCPSVWAQHTVWLLTPAFHQCTPWEAMMTAQVAVAVGDPDRACGLWVSNTA